MKINVCSFCVFCCGCVYGMHGVQHDGAFDKQVESVRNDKVFQVFARSSVDGPTKRGVGNSVHGNFARYASKGFARYVEKRAAEARKLRAENRASEQD